MVVSRLKPFHKVMSFIDVGDDPALETPSLGIIFFQRAVPVCRVEQFQRLAEAFAPP